MAFTALTQNHSAQDKSLWHEIRVAVNRRYAALGGYQSAGSMFQPVTADDIDTLEVGDIAWRFQYLMMYLTESYANPRVYLAGENAILENGSHAEWSSLSAGGLPRRLPESATAVPTWDDYDAEGWEYGSIRKGDIIGIWLIQDLQDLLRELTRISSRGGQHQITVQPRTLVRSGGSAWDTSPSFDFPMNVLDTSFTRGLDRFDFRAERTETDPSQNQHGNTHSKSAYSEVIAHGQQWAPLGLTQHKKYVYLGVIGTGQPDGDFYPLLKLPGIDPISEGTTMVIAVSPATTQTAINFSPPAQGDFKFADLFDSKPDDFKVSVSYDFFIIVDYEFNDGDTTEQPWEAS